MKLLITFLSQVSLPPAHPPPPPLRLRKRSPCQGRPGPVRVSVRRRADRRVPHFVPVSKKKKIILFLSSWLYYARTERQTRAEGAGAGARSSGRGGLAAAAARRLLPARGAAGTGRRVWLPAPRAGARRAGVAGPGGPLPSGSG